MSEEKATVTEQGEEKVMKFRKRAETTEVKEAKVKEPKAVKETKAKEPKVVKEVKVKETKAVKVKQPKTPKVELKIVAPKNVNVKVATFVTTATSDDKTKKLWMRGTTVGLTERVTGLKEFKAVTEEEAKVKHLGKTRCLGKVETQEELDDVVNKFFA